MYPLLDSERQSLLRGVGPRHAHSAVKSSHRARAPPPPSAHDGGSAAASPLQSPRSRVHSKRITAAAEEKASQSNDGQLAPLLQSPRGARIDASRSLLAAAAALPAPAALGALAAAAPLSTRALLQGAERSESGGRASLPSLAMHAHMVAAVWRETRCLASAQHHARAKQMHALKAAQVAAQTAQAAAEREREQRSRAPQPPAAAAHRANRLSFAVNLPSYALAAPASSSAAAAAAAAAATAAATPVAEPLASLDSLLNPRSLVHVAAALAVDQQQLRDQAQRSARAHAHHHSPKANMRDLDFSALAPGATLPHGHSGGSQSARSHADSFAVSSFTPTQSLSARTAHPSIPPPHPASHPASPSPPSTFLRHVLAVQHAWGQHLAYLAQAVYLAKCADLSLAPAADRRDKFVSRAVMDATGVGVLRLRGQGLAVQSARAVVRFLREVQACATPAPPPDRTPRGAGVAPSRGRVLPAVSTLGGAPTAGSIAAARRRAQMELQGLGTRRAGARGDLFDEEEEEASSYESSDTDDEDGDVDAEDPAAISRRKALERLRKRGSGGAEEGEEDQEEEDHEELLRRSFESSHASTFGAGPVRPARPAQGFGVVAFDGAAAAAAEAQAGASADATARGAGDEGQSQSQSLRDVAEGEERDDEESSHFPGRAESKPNDGDADGGEAPPSPGRLGAGGGLGAAERARRLLQFQRRPFHGLDLSDNALGDEGALELCVLFLPSAQQIQAEAAAAAVAGGGAAGRAAARAERKKQRRARRAQRAAARREGRDPDAEPQLPPSLLASSQTLSPLSCMKHLALRSNNLTPRGFALLFDALAHAHAPLLSLDLSAHSAAVVSHAGTSAGAVAVPAIAAAVPSSTASSGGSGSVGLGTMQIGLEGAHSLSQMLQRNTQLRTLTLHNVGLGSVPGALALVAAGVKLNRTITNLDLGANGIQGSSGSGGGGGGAGTGGGVGGAAGAELLALMHALRCSAVTDLTLSLNPLGSLGAVAVARGLLPASASLRRLRLDQCGIGPAGLAVLSAAAESAQVLTELHLSANELAGGRGAPEKEVQLHPALFAVLAQAGMSSLVVAPALAANLSLHSLHLNHSNIDDKTAVELFTCLQDHCTLHTLQLRSNRISCEGGQALGALLRASRSLEHVDLRMNFLAEEGGQAVASAVAFAPCLTHLSLQNNNLSNSTAESFLHSLPHSRLAVLLLDGNRIDFPHFHALGVAVARSKRRHVRSALAWQHGLVKELLKEKAKFADVLFQRDQAALQDRRSNEYLSSLVSGRKDHTKAELDATDALQHELGRLKLQALELQAANRAVQHSIVTETSRRDAKVHELQLAVESERTQQRRLRRRINKDSRKSGQGPASTVAGVAASAAATTATTPASASSSSSVATASSPTAASTSAAAAPSAPGAPGPSVEETSAETVLRLESRKLDLLRADVATALGDMLALVQSLEENLARVAAAETAAAAAAAKSARKSRRNRASRRRSGAAPATARSRSVRAGASGAATPKRSSTAAPSKQPTPLASRVASRRASMVAVPAGSSSSGMSARASAVSAANAAIAKG